MNPLYFEKIEKLQFRNIRVVNALQNANIQYVGELVQKRDLDLLRTKNFGRMSLRDVKEKLAEFKLKLGMTIQWPVRESYIPNGPLDQLVGIEARYKHAIEVLQNGSLQPAPQYYVQPSYGPRDGRVLERDLATTHPRPCARCHTATFWWSDSGCRCSICGNLSDGTPPPAPRPARTILGWQRLTHALATEKGFYETRPLNMGEQVLMMVCELAEVFEECRKGKTPTEIYIENGKPEGVPIEFADAVMRIMQWTHELGIDLEAAMLQKYEFNLTRPRLHGKRF